MENDLLITDTSIEDNLRNELIKSNEPKRKRIISKLLGAALGSIPWVGGFASALVDFKSDEGQVRNNEIYKSWLEEHTVKMKALTETLFSVVKRLNEFSTEIDERLESEEYLTLVRKSFKAWNNAETQEKRDLVRLLLTNSGVSQIITDDLVSLFIDWINLYNEVHFAVIKSIHKREGITRYEIWQELNGTVVREDSLEADLFKLLMRDLSTGGVIRQYRETNYYGEYIKKATNKSSNASKVVKSAFDNQEAYQLTELGKQFVHYTMNEVVTRVK